MSKRRGRYWVLVEGAVKAAQRLGQPFVGTAYQVNISTPTGTITRYIAGSNISNSFQHAYASALQAYHYASNSNGGDWIIGTVVFEGYLLEAAENLNRNPFSFGLGSSYHDFSYWDTQRDNFNNAVGARVGLWMHQNGVPLSELPDVLAFLNDQFLLAYPIDLTSAPTSRTVGIMSAGVVKTDEGLTRYDTIGNPSDAGEAALSALEAALEDSAWEDYSEYAGERSGDRRTARVERCSWARRLKDCRKRDGSVGRFPE